MTTPEPLKGERPWQHWELLVLSLMRQVPRDSPARRRAEQFLFDHGSGPEMALRESPDLPDPFACDKCGGAKAHFRTKGYRCLRCD